jgi:uncharacterized RDD family membrane protein YckC
MTGEEPGKRKYRREPEVLSTLPSSATSTPSWKQEVNRRLAAHKHRRGISEVDQDSADERHSSGSSRAAAAAARVAARYAKVPSYSEMQASEARVALRVAEAATRAAIEAQAAAQAVLDHIEIAAEQAEAKTESNAAGWLSWEDSKAPAESHDTGVQIRWEPDMPSSLGNPEVRSVGPASWDVTLEAHYEYDAGMIYEAVEAAQPIAANLIEFPREIVAPRRMRPRLGEGAMVDSDAQLSIFEVDPSTISTEPMAHAAGNAEPGWIGSSWQEIKLDGEPQPLPDYYNLAADEHKLYQAPFGRRMMATMVDVALIVGLVCGVIYLIASNVGSLPGKRVSEICGVVALVGFAALYEWFFLTFAKVTPGMRYAQLSLCTFDEEIPTREQIKGRLKAMLISVLPVGLGMLWSIFDEDQMSWHDRLSKTYLRLS